MDGIELPTGVAALVGLAGLPFIVVMIVEHIKQALDAARCFIVGLRQGYFSKTDASPYPLVRDVVCVVGAMLVRESGGLRDVIAGGLADNVSTVILVGLAVSFIAGQLHDRIPALTGTKTPAN